MIKIEFKEAQPMINHLEWDEILAKSIFRDVLFGYPKSDIKSVTFGCPSELVPDRSEILKQLGISQQEDEQNQIKWSKLI